jgi:hypothetical protein
VTLNVTNGDAPVPALRAGGVLGEILPWREVLHEGPVNGDRAAFLAAHSGQPVDAIRADLAERDAKLAAATEIVLWFEADLFDVLLLLQILDRVRDDQHVSLALAGQETWTPLARADVAALTPAPVTAAQLDAARQAWRAFTGDDPTRFVTDTPARPAIGDAMARLLEEYPAADSGLGRTERQLLAALRDGARTREEAFLASSAMEERPFMGDTTAFAILERLQSGAPYERWIGGVHLPAGATTWVYDAGTILRWAS